MLIPIILVTVPALAVIVAVVLDFRAKKPVDPVAFAKQKTKILKEATKSMEAIEEFKDALEVNIKGPVLLGTFMKWFNDFAGGFLPQKPLPKLSILPAAILLLIAGLLFAFVATKPDPVRPERKQSEQSSGGQQGYVPLPQNPPSQNHSSGNGGGGSSSRTQSHSQRYTTVERDTLIITRVEYGVAFPLLYDEYGHPIISHESEKCVPTDGSATGMVIYAATSDAPDSVLFSYDPAEPFHTQQLRPRPTDEDIQKGIFDLGPVVNEDGQACNYFASARDEAETRFFVIYYRREKIPERIPL